MEWLTQNWVWVLFAVGMIAMHLLGHGGHGGHGGNDDGQKTPTPLRKDIEQSISEPRSGHHR